jgi:hypothetical protein
MLPGGYTLLSGNYDTCDDSKSDLGENEPQPIDLLVKKWIDEFNKAMN